MRLIQYSYPTTRVVPALGFSRSPWTGLETEIDRLFNTAHQFPVDLYEDENNTYLRAQLPGISREDLNVEFVDGALTVSATRRQKDGDKENAFSFSRTVSVPNEVQADKVGAAYENGVLTVTLPKREEAKPRKISVQVS